MFAGKLVILEGMCHEHRQLAYKCRRLKNAVKIQLHCFGTTL